jgi:hypothetical protein
LACVPLPAPGPPNKITRIAALLDIKGTVKGGHYPRPPAE